MMVSNGDISKNWLIIFGLTLSTGAFAICYSIRSCDESTFDGQLKNVYKTRFYIGISPYSIKRLASYLGNAIKNGVYEELYNITDNKTKEQILIVGKSSQICMKKHKQHRILGTIDSTCRTCIIGDLYTVGHYGEYKYRVYKNISPSSVNRMERVLSRYKYYPDYSVIEVNGYSYDELEAHRRS